MNADNLKEIGSNEVVRKRLAKYMALQCFRDTKLEEFHGGTSPRSATGDYSDVKVLSPFGEIPWNRLSRLNNDEMKALMIDVVNHCDRVLDMLFTTSAGDDVIKELKKRDVVPTWDDPR